MTRSYGGPAEAARLRALNEAIIKLVDPVIDQVIRDYGDALADLGEYPRPERDEDEDYDRDR